MSSLAPRLPAYGGATSICTWGQYALKRWIHNFTSPGSTSELVPLKLPCSSWPWQGRYTGNAESSTGCRASGRGNVLPCDLPPSSSAAVCGSFLGGGGSSHSTIEGAASAR